MKTTAVFGAAALTLAACGASEETASVEGASDSGVTIAVTTNILGDVVDALVGDQADVFVVMPVGADPHDFQASAQEVDALLSADLVVSNGADFEEGLEDVIESARTEGLQVVEAIDFVETIEFGADSHDEHDDEEHDDEHADEEHDDEHADEEHDDEHADEEHDDEHADEEHDDEHAHDGADPHFFTDPGRMIDAVEGISAALAEVEGIDADALASSTDAYLADLIAVDEEMSELLLAIPEEQRVLVTNHEVFGYVADRFEFEIVGVVVPGGSTGDAVSAGELAELAEEIVEENVPAIFVDSSSPAALAETLAGEVGEIEIVELYTESLGESDSEGATYIEMIRTNATRIASALS